jgi:hypothetical protein
LFAQLRTTFYFYLAFFTTATVLTLLIGLLETFLVLKAALAAGVLAAATGGLAAIAGKARAASELMVNMVEITLFMIASS